MALLQRTRVSPEYVDKIYWTAFAVVVVNVVLVDFDIFPARFLNAPTEIKNLVWPLNQGYTEGLRSFGFGQLEINAVTQTTFASSIIMIVAMAVRVGLELATPRTEFRPDAILGSAFIIAMAITMFWFLQFTEKRSLFYLDIHLPMLKNLFELNACIAALYLFVAEFLCQIIAYLRRVGTRSESEF